MSGGHFDYKQYEIGYITDSIEQIIINYRLDKENSWGTKVRDQYSPAEIEKFEEAVYYLEKAQIYAQRVDWLLSGDDGSDSFFARLDAELKELDEKSRFKYRP